MDWIMDSTDSSVMGKDCGYFLENVIILRHKNLKIRKKNSNFQIKRGFLENGYFPPFLGQYTIRVQHPKSPIKMQLPNNKKNSHSSHLQIPYRCIQISEMLTFFVTLFQKMIKICYFYYKFINCFFYKRENKNLFLTY